MAAPRDNLDQQVLDLYTKGQSNKQIAKALGKPYPTIQYRVKRLGLEPHSMQQSHAALTERLTSQPEPLPEGFEATVQPFKALPPHIEAAFRASIVRFGVLMPVVQDQYGRILDGHQRARVAEELGKAYDVIVHPVASDEEALQVAKTLNAERRQLSEAQRRDVAFVLREEGHSYRAIGGALGVSQVQAMTDVKRAQAAQGVKDLTPARPVDEEEEAPAPGVHHVTPDWEKAPVKDVTPTPGKRITGLDRKSYPATRSKAPAEERDRRDREIDAVSKALLKAVQVAMHNTGRLRFHSALNQCLADYVQGRREQLAPDHQLERIFNEVQDVWPQDAQGKQPTVRVR